MTGYGKMYQQERAAQAALPADLAAKHKARNDEWLAKECRFIRLAWTAGLKNPSDPRDPFTLAAVRLADLYRDNPKNYVNQVLMDAGIGPTTRLALTERFKNSA